MRLLLDTNVFYWALSRRQKLSSKAVKAITDPANELILSCASIWELITKVGTGKLDLPVAPADFDHYCERLGIAAVLSIHPAHVYQLRALPRAHDDPFDRMLVAQAQVEDLRLVSADTFIAEHYMHDVIW